MVGASKAAVRAVHEAMPRVRVPGIGAVHVPPPEHLAWYAGVVSLAVLEIVDWPVAVLLAVGKALADNRSSETIRDFGTALEHAG